jgi:purine nucleosidase
MGGAAMWPGNVTPVAEADALHDPEALALVLSQPWDFLQIGLDVTDETAFERSDLEQVQASDTPAAKLVAAGAPSYMTFYEPIFGRYACAMHSPLTVAVVAHPELILREQTFPMTVELNGTHTRGMTIIDRRRGQESAARPWTGWKLVRIALEVDRPTFVKRYVERVVAG